VQVGGFATGLVGFALGVAVGFFPMTLVTFTRAQLRSLPGFWSRPVPSFSKPRRSPPTAMSTAALLSFS